MVLLAACRNNAVLVRSPNIVQRDKEIFAVVAGTRKLQARRFQSQHPVASLMALMMRNYLHSIRRPGFLRIRTRGRFGRLV